MELKELKDMIEPVENWEYEFSGTREVGKSYMQNLLNNKDKVINDLLKRISDLEFEVERLQKVVKVKDEGFKASTEDLCEESTKIEKAIEYIEQNEFYLDYKTGACIKGVMPLLDILKGVDKE